MVGQALNLEKLGWQEGQGHRLVSLTMHTEIDDTLGHTVGIGSHAAIGSMVAGPGTHNGNNGAVGADVDVVLQLLVPNLPLKVDGRCSLMDKALETGILTLVYRAAGWFNGDDRASEAVGRPFTGGYCDLEGSLMLRVGAASHLAHILAGVGRGDMIEPQQGAMSLVSGRQAAPSFVPCDLGMGLPWYHAFQIHSLPFSQMGGGGLYVDRLSQSRGRDRAGFRGLDGDQDRSLQGT